MAQEKDTDKDFLDIDLSDDAQLGSLGLDASGEDALANVAAPARLQERMGDGVLVFENKKYAVGLKWLVSEGENETELALKRAKSFKADFYCLRQSVVSQHGFGYLHLGHRIGMPALASVAADTLVGEWHGVFVTDNGWWYLAVHGDNIAPDGDILFASEEDAYNHFVAQSEGYRWPRSYAPESWNIQEVTGEIALGKLIGQAAGPALKPVTLDAIFSGARNKNLAVGSGAVILLLLVLSLIGQQMLPSLIPTQAQLPIPNLQVSDNLQTPPKEVVPLDGSASADLTAFELIRPSSYMAQCMAGLSAITLPLPGWNLTHLKCHDKSVEGEWQRQIGSLQMIEPYLARFPEDSTRSVSDGNTLTIIAPPGKLDSPATMQGGLLDANTVMAEANKRLSNIGKLDTKLERPAKSQELLQNYDIIMQQEGGLTTIGQNKPILEPIGRDDLPYVSITLKTKTPPNMIGRYFDLPGVVVRNVEGSLKDEDWSYEAKVILKPEQRLVEANVKAKSMQTGEQK